MAVAARRFAVARRGREFELQRPRGVYLGYHDFSAGTLSPSQPGLALTGRVEARLLYDLYSVDGGVKLLQKRTKHQVIR